MDLRLFLRAILCSGLLLSACSDESGPQKPSTSSNDDDKDDDESDDDDDDSTSSRRDAGKGGGKDAGKDAGKGGSKDAGKDAGKHDANKHDGGDEEEDTTEGEDETEDDKRGDAGVTEEDTGPEITGERTDASVKPPAPPTPGDGNAEPDACAEVAEKAQTIITDKCNACHAATQPVLTSVAGIRGAAQRIVERVTSDDPKRWMPKGASTPLPTDEQDAIVQWMQCLQE